MRKYTYKEMPEERRRNLLKLGNLLYELRGRMSLREAAERSGLSHAYIRDIELTKNRANGGPIIPSPDTLHRLAVLYHASYDQLMELAGHRPVSSEDEILLLIDRLTWEQRKIVKTFIRALVQEDFLKEYLESGGRQ